MEILDETQICEGIYHHMKKTGNLGFDLDAVDGHSLAYIYGMLWDGECENIGVGDDGFHEYQFIPNK